MAGAFAAMVSGVAVAVYDALTIHACANKQNGALHWPPARPVQAVGVALEQIDPGMPAADAIGLRDRPARRARPHHPA